MLLMGIGGFLLQLLVAIVLKGNTQLFLGNVRGQTIVFFIVARNMSLNHGPLLQQNHMWVGAGCSQVRLLTPVTPRAFLIPS